MFERLLLVWLMLLSAVAFWWPTERWGFDPFLDSVPWMSYMISFTMFNVGVMLPRDEVQQMRQRWGAVLFGTTIQYTAMPLLGWSMAKLFQLDPACQMGLILVGCVPGAMASNVITMNAKGHTSYSVSLTTASTILSPLVVPFTLYLAAGERVQQNSIEIGTKLLLEVVLPVVAGVLLVRLLPACEPTATKIGPVAANLMILWIVAIAVAKNRATMAHGTLVVLPALLAVNLLGYLAGYLAGTAVNMPESMRRALTIEVGMQNAGLGTLIATQMFPNEPLVTVPTALYTFGCVLTAMILAHFWSLRPPEKSV